MRIVKSKVFKVFKYLLIPCLLIGGFYVCERAIYLGTRDQAELYSRINPAIRPEILRLEKYANQYVLREEVNRKEYEKCKKLVDLLSKELEEEVRINKRGGDYPNKRDRLELYVTIFLLGFDLPPFFLDREPTEEEIKTADEEYFKLEKESFEKLTDTDTFIQEIKKETEDYIKKVMVLLEKHKDQKMKEEIEDCIENRPRWMMLMGGIGGSKES